LPDLILSTCGTSLLTNGASPELRSWLTEHANARHIEPSDAARFADHLQGVRAKWLTAPEKDARRLSAEYNGLRALATRQRLERPHHLLVHTDTVQGEATADLLEARLTREGAVVERRSRAGLQTADSATLRLALGELAGELHELIEGYRSSGYRVTFNLTGGFKSLNGFLQALGSVFADSCVYLFESSDDLIRIPRLPVTLDGEAELRRGLDVFRRLHVGYPVRATDAGAVAETLLFEVDGIVDRSPWGDMFWHRYRPALLGAGPLPPLSPNLQLSRRVRSELAGLPPDRCLLANEALDALSARLDGHRPPLKSETFRVLAGNPAPPSTHELYAWSDRDARRFLGHFEGERFVVDALVPHL
jgi:putative CRISPR-associated protein (TIGR02619 family)